MEPSPRRSDADANGGVATMASPEALFASILDIAADAIIVVSDSQHILHFNQGASQIFGYAAEEIVGRPLTDLLPVRHQGAHANHVKRFGAGEQRSRRMAERREIYGLRKGGVEFPAEASISRLETRQGTVYTVVLRDITDRTIRARNEHFLSEASGTLGTSLELGRTLQALANVPVPYLAEAMIVDCVGDDDQWHRVVSRSDDPALQARLEAIAGDTLSWDDPWRAIDVIRSARAEIVPSVTDDWLEAHTENAGRLARLQALGVHSAMFVPLIARDRALGVLTFLRLAKSAYLPADLALAQALGTRAAYSLDNSRLYSMAQRATKAREDVLSVVSHDLGNPLAAIRLCAAALQQAPPDDADEAAQLMQAITNSAEWMSRLIQDLVDVSAIERGRLSVERRTEAVLPILEQSRAMFAPQAEERGVALRVEVGTNVPPVFCDTGRLVQVLANLVGNALKFTERDGTITLSAEGADGAVLIRVRDTGSGIPADQLPRIFERYYTRRRGASKSGSGLGLSIARGIIEAHGGTISADSTLGCGTTITISLPAAS